MAQCTSYYGATVLIEDSRLTFRPAAYALVAVEGHVLLEVHRRTGKYFFPGTGLTPGKGADATLVDLLREEAGLPIRVRELLLFKESFSYFDPLDAAYHNLSFFYACAPTTLEPSPELEAAARDPERFSWVDARTLTPAHFHAFGHEVFAALWPFEER